MQSFRELPKKAGAAGRNVDKGRIMCFMHV